ncbi:hypothetical protein PIB30_067521 [Stylosanthes scabra]|uniref:Uncharacterized protein n=1 Tax=Stylosanthes scabra TaxID=79078 RepID=A0ABU6XNI7_9FABA|nr:hypothetical protein [Stylosanthes scabra]
MCRLAFHTQRLLGINPSMVSQLSIVMVSTKVARIAFVSTLRTPGHELMRRLASRTRRLLGINPRKVKRKLEKQENRENRGDLQNREAWNYVEPLTPRRDTPRLGVAKQHPTLTTNTIQKHLAMSPHA